MKHIPFTLITITIALLMQSCGRQETSAKKEASEKPVPPMKNEFVTDAAIEADVRGLARIAKEQFPPDTVLKEFGPGTHNFYLAYTHIKGKKGGSFYFLRYLMLVDGAWTYPVERHTAFFNKMTDDSRYFKISPQDIDKNLVKYYDVKVGIDNKKRVIHPWTITEVDAKRFYPVFTKPYTRNDFLTSSFSSIVGGYEAMSRKIVYPEEAKHKGVSGKVLVVAYAEASGEVVGTQLIKGIGFGCDEAALKAVSECTFYPAESRFNATIPVEFELEYKPEDYDLTTTDVSFTPSEVKAGEHCKISFNVVNLGRKPTPAKKFETMMYIDKELVFATIEMPSVSQGKDVRFWVQWTPKRPGVFNYEIYIDGKKALNESIRENNTITGTVTVH